MPNQVPPNAIDPRGIVSAGLAVLGGTIASGILLGRVAAKLVDKEGGALATLLATKEKALDATSVAALGGAIGAGVAVIAGLAAAVVARLIVKEPRTQLPPVQKKSVMINLKRAPIGAIVGAIAGLVVAAGIGSLARIAAVEWAIVGSVVGGISGLLDSVAF